MIQLSIAIPAGILPKADVAAHTNGHTADGDALAFRRFIAGDDAAFVQLFNTHNNRLYSYCTNIVHDADAAEDITQEMWMRVLRMRGESREVSNPAGLFVTIVRNLSFNYLARHRRQSGLETLGESMPAPDHERTVEEEMVLLALERLSFDHREVLILSVYSGYTLEEIAVMLGKSREAIWKRASRARAQLSKLVMEMLENERRTMRRTDDATVAEAGAHHE